MDVSIPLAAFGLGVALGTSPGPVQLLLFTEASRGGVPRGLRVMAGANTTFGVMMLGLVVGLASLEPSEPFLRAVRVVGGAFLVFLAVDALRANATPPVVGDQPAGLHPSLRGVIAVLLNPGVYVFLATTGAAIAASAVHAGGRSLGAATAVALVAGVSVMDATMVLLGAGAHRVGQRFLRALTIALALGLAVLGIWLIVLGIRG